MIAILAFVALIAIIIASFTVVSIIDWFDPTPSAWCTFPPIGRAPSGVHPNPPDSSRPDIVPPGQNRKQKAYEHPEKIFSIARFEHHDVEESKDGVISGMVPVPAPKSVSQAEQEFSAIARSFATSGPPSEDEGDWCCYCNTVPNCRIPLSEEARRHDLSCFWRRAREAYERWIFEIDPELDPV
jgi:hypothetical protein